MTAQQSATTRRSEMAVLDNAFLLLEQATALDEVKEIRDKAEAVRAFAKSAKKGLEIQNKGAELKLRAECKAGEFLSSLQFRGGDRISNGHRDRLILEDLGISQNQSKRLQKEALLPADQFEAYVQQAQQDEVEISSTALLRLAKKHTAGPTNGRRKPVRLRPLDENTADKPVRMFSASELSELRQAVTVINGHRESAVTLLGETDVPALGVYLDANRMRILRRILAEIDEAAQQIDVVLQ